MAEAEAPSTEQVPMETEQPPQPVEAEPVGGDDAEATAEVAPAKNVFQETTQTGKRQRKQVARMEVSAPAPVGKEMEIPNGKGTPLGDIENVAYYINKYQSASDELKMLYRFAFGKIGKKLVVKKHLRLFNGLEGGAGSEKLESQINARGMSELKRLLTICDLDIGGKKDDLVERLLGFLAEPKPSGKKSLAARDQEKREKLAKKKEREVKRKAGRAKKKEQNKRKREKVAAKKAKAAATKAKAQAKKKKAKEEEESSEEDDSEEEEESSEEDESEEEEEEEEVKPKKKKAKAAAVDSDDDDEPIGSIRKPKITDAILKQKLEEYSQGPEFETLSLKMIRAKLQEDLGQDMTEYKPKIKEIITTMLT